MRAYVWCLCVFVDGVRKVSTYTCHTYRTYRMPILLHFHIYLPCCHGRRAFLLALFHSMSQTSIRRVQRRPRPPCSSSPFTDCPECLGGRALARCARVRPTGAAAVSALLLLAATSSAFVPSRQVTWSTTGTCITTQLKAISSKKLKVKNFQRQRERME